MKKAWMNLIAAALLTASGLVAAEVVVKIGPPRNVNENRGKSPGHGYVYTNGYQRWDGHAYSWSKGSWQQPPHQKAHWQQSQWQKRKNGEWVFVEGRWH